MTSRSSCACRKSRTKVTFSFNLFTAKELSRSGNLSFHSPGPQGGEHRPPPDIPDILMCLYIRLCVLKGRLS